MKTKIDTGLKIRGVIIYQADIIRFWKYVDKSNECWLWQGYINPDGYGMFGLGGRASNGGINVTAHRMSLTIKIGTIEEGLVADHLRQFCQNRHCVRPEHLEAVTNEINIKRGFYFLTNGQKALERARIIDDSKEN